MHNLEIFETIADLHAAAAEEIARQATKKVKSGQRFTIALSGGSTPRGIFELLSKGELLAQLPWRNMHFFWGDERHVPPDHPDSNYRMAWESLLSAAPVPEKNVHRVAVEMADPMQAAEDYRLRLAQFFDLEIHAMPRFDLVLLGMGPDGHTASLFPGTKALRVGDKSVAANWVGKFDTWRITLTAPAINAAKNIIVLVAGESKAPALRASLEGPHEPDQLPIQLIKPAAGSLVWMVDRPAAARLSKISDPG